MSVAPKAKTLRLPRTLVVTALRVAVAGCTAGALGCGSATPLAPDAGARDLSVAVAADLAPATGDACGLVVSCMPVVVGANCDGSFCSLTGCPTGCEPFV